MESLDVFTLRSLIKKRQVRTRRLNHQKALRRTLIRQQIFVTFILCNTLLNNSIQRELWERERTSHWWEQIVNSFTSDDWIANFRMLRSTFLYICNELRGAIQKRDRQMRPAISVEKRVAITLWYMSTNSDYRTIGHLFGVSTASVCHIRREVCQAVVKLLLHKYIHMPTDGSLQAIVSGFQKKGFPQCAGAIDGCHIAIESPREFPADYHNRKGWHSVILQGLVDHNACFMDINVGWPGRVYDSRVLQNSQLYAKGESGNLFPSILSQICGVTVPCVIVGDAAYPLKPWLMKPYINTGTLSPEQRTFNHRLSQARITVEHAFGLLKGRWRCLRTRLAIDISEVPELVGACCILHNICQLHGEGFDSQWLEDDESPNSTTPTTTCISSGADRVRTELTEFFKDH